MIVKNYVLSESRAVTRESCTESPLRMSQRDRHQPAKGYKIKGRAAQCWTITSPIHFVFVFQVAMYAMQRSTTLLLALSPLLTLVQASAVDGIEPAAATVPNTPAAGASLQAAEKLQLTDEVIERLETEEATSNYAKYFKFGDSDAPAYSASCKTFPGDDAWPKDTTWHMFDVLLGGALIPTKPIAASCYDTRWGKKDAAACSDVINNFTSPLFHSADPTSSKLSPLTDFEA